MESYNESFKIILTVYMERICSRFVPGYTPERGRGEGGAYTRGLKDMILWYLFQVCPSVVSRN